MFLLGDLNLLMFLNCKDETIKTLGNLLYGQHLTPDAMFIATANLFKPSASRAAAAGLATRVRGGASEGRFTLRQAAQSRVYPRKL